MRRQFTSKTLHFNQLTAEAQSEGAAAVKAASAAATGATAAAPGATAGSTAAAGTVSHEVASTAAGVDQSSAA